MTMEYPHTDTKVMGIKSINEDLGDDKRELSDEDILDEDEVGPRFNMGMSMKEKIEARKPWRNSVIIKLVGRKIGYHYLLKCIQTTWKTQSFIMLIDLPSNFFIIRFASRLNYNTALLNGPWMIREHYLIVQRSVPSFLADTAIITILLVWVKFPILPME